MINSPSQRAFSLSKHTVVACESLIKARGLFILLMCHIHDKKTWSKFPSLFYKLLFSFTFEIVFDDSSAFFFKNTFNYFWTMINISGF